jgi:hypothetical protein
MKLLTLNVDNKFTTLANKMVDGKGSEVLFVNWLPNNPKQNDIVKSTPKDVRLVIFDRYSNLTAKEVSYYSKRNTILLEPVVMSRPEFLFMPYWIERIDLPLSTWDKNRTFHTGYKGDTISTEAEVILTKFIKSDIHMCAGISTQTTPQNLNVLRELMNIGDYKWDEFNTTIITGSDYDYHYGVLPDISNHLKYGVIPLISHKHKWFHALFKEFILFDTSLVSWYNKNFSPIYYGFMEQMYQNIELYMPEMLIENFIQTIVSLC